MAGPHQCGVTQSGRQVKDCLATSGTPLLCRVMLAALVLVSAPGAAAHDPKPVHYVCANGTRLQATCSPLSASPGLIMLVFAGSSTETLLP